MTSAATASASPFRCAHDIRTRPGACRAWAVSGQAPDRSGEAVRISPSGGIFAMAVGVPRLPEPAFAG